MYYKKTALVWGGFFVGTKYSKEDVLILYNLPVG
jgi:hypothetical protein